MSVTSRCITSITIAIGIMHWVATGNRKLVANRCIIPIAIGNNAAGRQWLSRVSPLNIGWVWRGVGDGRERPPPLGRESGGGGKTKRWP